MAEIRLTGTKVGGVVMIEAKTIVRELVRLSDELRAHGEPVGAQCLESLAQAVRDCQRQLDELEPD